MSVRVFIKNDQNGNPITVAKPKQEGDCVIVHCLDENGDVATVAAPMGRLWHFATFRGKTEIFLEDVPLVVFEAFMDFIYDKEHPEELDIFNYPELEWALPHLSKFLHNLTKKEFNTPAIRELYENIVTLVTTPVPKEDIVFHNDSIFFDQAIKV